MTLMQLVYSFVMAAIMIIIAMMNILALWKIFKKANKPGWFSIIPFYNIFTLFEIIGMSPWWLLILFSIYFFRPFLFTFFYTLNLIPILLVSSSLLILIIVWYIMICMCINLCRCFSKDDAFLIGLVFMPYIFLMILAFGEDTYKGPNPINDFVFNQKNKVPTIKHCLKCGKKAPNNSMNFCTNCGNPLLKENN